MRTELDEELIRLRRIQWILDVILGILLEIGIWLSIVLCR